MPRPRLPVVAVLLVSLAALAGCDKDPPRTPYKPKYDYGPVDPSQFHADPAPNRTVAADALPLSFVDADGKPVDLGKYRGKSNVVLVVTKGMPSAYGGAFCPGCLAQVGSLAANHEEFKKRDGEVLVVFPGASDKLGEFLAAAKVDGAGGNPKTPFPLLLDKDLKAVDTLGIRGDQAKPSTYIVDKRGNVVFAYVGETTTDRPAVKAVLGQLDKLAAQK